MTQGDLRENGSEKDSKSKEKRKKKDGSRGLGYLPELSLEHLEDIDRCGIPHSVVCAIESPPPRLVDRICHNSSVKLVRVVNGVHGEFHKEATYFSESPFQRLINFVV